MGLSQAETTLIQDSWKPVAADYATHGPAFYCVLFKMFGKHQSKFSPFRGKSISSPGDMDAAGKKVATNVLTAVGELVVNVNNDSQLEKLLGDRVKEHRDSKKATAPDFKDIFDALLAYLKVSGVSGATEAAWITAINSMMNIVNTS